MSNRCDDNTSKLTYKQKKLNEDVSASTTGTYRWRLTERMHGRRGIVPGEDFPCTTTLSCRPGDDDWHNLSESGLNELIFHELVHTVEFPGRDRDNEDGLTDPHNIDDSTNSPFANNTSYQYLMMQAKNKCGE